MRDTIDMAREAGIKHDIDGVWCEFFELKAFEALVRADERNSWPAEMEAMERQVNILTDALAQEREACARVCDELPAPDIYGDDDKSMWDVTCVDCAAAIRARSSK